MTSKTKYASRFGDLWDWLTRPSAAVHKADDRRRARLLSGLLIPIVPLSAAALLIRMRLDPSFVPSPVSAVGILLMAITYTISRTAYYRWAARLTLNIFVIAIPLIAITSYSAADFKMLLVYLALALVLSSMLLPILDTFILAVVSLASVAVLPLFIPEVSLTTVLSPLTFLAELSMLLVLSIRHRDLLEKDRQAALADREERYRTLFNGVPVGLSRTSPSGHIIDANPAFRAILGFASQDALTANVSDLYVDTGERERLLALADREGLAQDCEVRLRRQDGTIIWTRINLQVVRDPSGQVLHYEGSMQDITEHKQIMEELLKLRKAVETSGEVIFLTDYEGTFTYVNPEFTRLYGHPAGEVVGSTTPRVLKSGHHSRADYEVFWKTILGKQVVKGEVVNKVRSGSLVEIETSVSPILDDGEEIIGFLAVQRDITERKRVQEELERYRNHLEELVEQRTAELKAANDQLVILSRVKDEFVSNVSHELRTPITSLKLYEHLLERGTGSAEEYLGALKRETERLEHTIEDLLLLSRLDQGRTEPSLSPTDLNRLAEQYVADRQVLAQARGLTLVFEGHPDLPVVLADLGLLSQALGILLTNALNYTPSGGRVTVRTATRAQDGAQWLGFSVSDTGPGIVPEDRAHLFERFYRGKTGRESRVPGTGLGLAIAREIAQRHNGEIAMDCYAPGAGATFHIWLPASADALSSDAECLQEASSDDENL